jgi:Mg-chelatase subunit ChlD
MNLVFVVDVSGSISKDDCLYARSYIKAVIEQLNTAQNGVHVAGMSFSDMIEFSFSFKTNKNDILNALEDLGCPGGWTMISVALEMAKDTFMTSAAGPPGVRNVTILISDGRDFTAGEAIIASDSLKKEVGMEIFSVGVGAFDERVLKAIANSPSEIYFFSSIDYSDLEKYVQNLYGHMCNKTVDCVLSDWKNMSRCSVTCGDGQILQEREVIVEPWNGGKECPIGRRYIPCRKHSCEVTSCIKDLIIILDDSSSITKGVFDDELVEFAYDLVESIPISKSDVLVAVVVFNQAPMTAIGFKDYDSKEGLLQQIKQLRYQSGLTNLPFALLHAAKILEDPTAGHRPWAPDYVIVLTDGETGLMYYFPHAARLMKRVADKVFSVGVVGGGHSTPSGTTLSIQSPVVGGTGPSAAASAVLSEMASMPQYLYVIHSEDVGEAAEPIVVKICPPGEAI